MEVSLENVEYWYSSHATEQPKPALKNITLTIPENQWVSIIGQTGSGKSTLVKVMKGLLPPASGKIKINNNVVREAKESKVIHEIGMVFQYPEHQLFETTVLKDLSFGPKNLGWDSETILKKSQEMIHLVGLDESYLDQAPFHLSGGEKRRIAIAGILIMDPHVLILDEPTAGLDPSGKQMILQMIDRWRRKGNRTVILITHQMNDVAEYSDEVIVMHQGSLLYQTDPLSLFCLYEEELKALGLDSPDYVKLLKEINRKTDRKLEVESLKEEHIIHRIADYFLTKEKKEHEA